MHKRSQHAVEQAEEQMHLLVSKDQRSFIRHFKTNVALVLVCRCTACVPWTLSHSPLSPFAFVHVASECSSFWNRFCVHLRALDMLSMFSIHSDVACEKISVWVFVYKFAFAQHNKQSVFSLSLPIAVLYYTHCLTLTIQNAAFSSNTRNRLPACSPNIQHFILHSSNAIRFVRFQNANGKNKWNKNFSTTFVICESTTELRTHTPIHMHMYKFTISVHIDLIARRSCGEWNKFSNFIQIHNASERVQYTLGYTH